LKRIVFSDQAKADIRTIPQPIAMNILTAIHRLAETGAGRVKTLRDQEGEKRLRVGDYRVRFTEESGEGKESSESEGALHIHAVRNRKEAYR
jgi:mRNA-degrading endonuclease RelE of RelBE toxin-antitoxin system